MNSCPEWLSTMQGPLVIETTCLAPLVIRAHLSFKQPAFLSCCKLKNSKSGHWPPTLPRAGALAGPIAGDPSLLPRGDSTPTLDPSSTTSLPSTQAAGHPWWGLGGPRVGSSVGPPRWCLDGHPWWGLGGLPCWPPQSGGSPATRQQVRRATCWRPVGHPQLQHLPLEALEGEFFFPF